MTAGWTWKIPMLGRFGSGLRLLQSLRHPGRRRREDFCELWNLDPGQDQAQQDPVPGRPQPAGLGQELRRHRARRPASWSRSSRPASTSSTPPSTSWPSTSRTRASTRVLIDRFNREIEIMFDDYPRLHPGALPGFAPRDDTPFWRANKQELPLSDNIQEKIATYKAGLPINLPITDEDDVLRQLRGRVPQLLDQRQLLLHLVGPGPATEPVLALPGPPAGITAAGGRCVRGHPDAGRRTGPNFPATTSSSASCTRADDQWRRRIGRPTPAAGPGRWACRDPHPILFNLHAIAPASPRSLECWPGWTGLHLPGQGVPVHHRHHQVQQDHGGQGRLLSRCSASVRCWPRRL